MDVEHVTVIKYQAKINKQIAQGKIQPIQHNQHTTIIKHQAKINK
jgi:hypothetical protein